MSWEQGLIQLPMRNRRRQKGNPHIKRHPPPRTQPIRTRIHFLHIHREYKRLLGVGACQAQMFHLESLYLPLPDGFHMEWVDSMDSIWNSL